MVDERAVQYGRGARAKYDPRFRSIVPLAKTSASRRTVAWCEYCPLDRLEGRLDTLHGGAKPQDDQHLAGRLPGDSLYLRLLDRRFAGVLVGEGVRVPAGDVPPFRLVDDSVGRDTVGRDSVEWQDTQTGVFTRFSTIPRWKSPRTHVRQYEPPALELIGIVDDVTGFDRASDRVAGSSAHSSLPV